MSKPFNQYIIKSSHNSYLNSCQICDYFLDPNYILKILNDNFKAIELDLQSKDDEIVVYHGSSSCICSKPILFTNLLDLIETYILQNNDTLPIFIFLELNTDKQDEIADIINYNLRIRLPNHKIDFFSEIPESFRNKVIFCSGGNLQSEKLKNIIQMTYQ